MNARPKARCDLRITLPASLEAAEAFFGEIRRRARTLLPEERSFTAELLAREAVTNAVLHGCSSDPNKRIHCCVRLKGTAWMILVEDEGDGFNWRGAWSNHAEVSAPSGRGLELLRRYASRIRFNSRGNTVAILMRTPPREQK